MTLLKRLLAILLVPYCLWLVLAYRYHFIDGVNLAFHEAGHLVFGILGETIHILGGSLGQLVFPVACMVHFWRKQQRYEAFVCGIWLGESLMYLAEYMGDAQARALPLVGGHIHDWHWLFSRAGLLDYSKGIGMFVHAIAALVVIVSMVQVGLLAFSAAGENSKKAV